MTAVLITLAVVSVGILAGLIARYVRARRARRAEEARVIELSRFRQLRTFAVVTRCDNCGDLEVMDGVCQKCGESHEDARRGPESFRLHLTTLAICVIAGGFLDAV